MLARASAKSILSLILLIRGNCPTVTGVVMPRGLAYKPVARPAASWRSGYAADCKSVYLGSIPGEASSNVLNVLSRLRFALSGAIMLHSRFHLVSRDPLSFLLVPTPSRSVDAILLQHACSLVLHHSAG